MNMKAKMECKTAINVREHIYATGEYILCLHFCSDATLYVHKPMPFFDMLYFLIRVNGFSLFMNSLY